MTSRSPSAAVSRLALPAASGVPQVRSAFSGKKKMGCQPSASSAARATFFGAERGDHDRDALADGVIDQLERLPETGALIAWQGERVVPALVVKALAPPDHPADLDQLPGTAHRGVVGHAVPALDHLRAAGAEAQREPAAGDEVEPGRGHRGQRGGP